MIASTKKYTKQNKTKWIDRTLGQILKAKYTDRITQRSIHIHTHKKRKRKKKSIYNKAKGRKHPNQ